MSESKLLLVAIVAICGLAGRPAAAGEYDGLLSVSWAPNTVVDTLVVDGPGTYDCYLMLDPRSGPLRFMDTQGTWVFGPGLTPQSIEVLTAGSPASQLVLQDHGRAVVWVADFSCTRAADSPALARITVQVDPALFVGGAATIAPLPPPDAAAPRLIMAEYDPQLQCIGYRDFVLVPGVVALDQAAPAEATRFGALKARYR